MEPRRSSFDVRIGNGGDVQFIFEQKPQADEFSETIKRAVLINNDKVVEEADKFVVRMNENTYNDFLQGAVAPKAVFRIGRAKTSPLHQIVFSDFNDANNYVQLLNKMDIIPIEPDLKNIGGTWVSKGVNESKNKNEYIIRIDAASKKRLDALVGYFNSLKSFNTLNLIEKELNFLLFQFKTDVLIKFAASKDVDSIKRINDIVDYAWMSNQEKINKINHIIEDRKGGWKLFRDSRENLFIDDYVSFKLKQKSDEKIQVIEAGHLDADRVAADKAKELLTSQNTVIQRLLEEAKQRELELVSTKTQLVQRTQELNTVVQSTMQPTNVLSQDVFYVIDSSNPSPFYYPGNSFVSFQQSALPSQSQQLDTRYIPPTLQKN
jgi:hypothetical protein